MRLLIDKIVIDEIFKKLGLVYEVVAEIEMEKHKFVHTESGNFYIKSCDDAEPTQAIIVRMDDDNLWQLDKFQSCLIYTKKYACVCKNSKELSFETDKDCEDCFFAYFDRQSGCFDKSDESNTIGKVIDEKNDEDWQSEDSCNDELFNVFKENIDYCVESEYSSSFSKTLRRKCLGKISLIINDTAGTGEIYVQDAIVCAVKHDTGFCVLEIFVYNCCIGGNKLLNYYCGEQLGYLYRGEKLTCAELMERCGMVKYGQKRSMVFAYGDVSDTEIINALANEEFPMGKIGGDFERKVMHENIAQYDTARVYVSVVTMIEVCKTITTCVEERISYHAIEIFFVELLLLQDAAIDKVYIDLRSDNVIDSEEKVNKVAEKYEQISFDMAQASAFANYEQFNFPTVRISAKNVVKNFGIEYVFEKYEANKELLASMIQSNKRKIEARQEKIKNYFLFLLSAIATVGTIGQMIHSIYQDLQGGVQSYTASLAIVFFAYCMYRLLVILGKINKKEP